MSFEGNVRVTVEAQSEGEDVYERHAAGLQKVGAAAQASAADVERAGFRFEGARAALTGLNLTVLSAERAMRLFGITNEGLTRALDAVVTGLTIARSALAIYKAVTESVTLANWARSASEVAASGPFAPIVVAIILAALGALTAFALFGRSTTAAFGIDTLVTGPRAFVAGEAGPEHVKITPAGAASGGFSVGPVSIMIVTPDPEAAGRAVADYLIRLKQAGR